MQSKKRTFKAQVARTLEQHGVVLPAQALIDDLAELAHQVYARRKAPAGVGPEGVSAPKDSQPPRLTPHQAMTAAVAVVCELVAGPYAGRTAAALLRLAEPPSPELIVELYGRGDAAPGARPITYWYAVRCAGIEHPHPPSPDGLLRSIGPALAWHKAEQDKASHAALAGTGMAPTSARVEEGLWL